MHVRDEENDVIAAVDKLVGLLRQEGQTVTHIVQHARYPERRV